MDSLLSVLPSQEGRKKVETMMELSTAFFDFSFDDCIDWGEKAIKEAHAMGFVDLEADAISALGVHYGNHIDLDLEQEYLKKAFELHKALGDDDKALDDLWSQAYFEQVLGNIDSALIIYEKVLLYAEQRNDTLTMAKSYANMAVIQYQLYDFERSEAFFKKCKTLYLSIGDELEVSRTNANLANLYMEWGKFAESRKLYREAISAFERWERYDFLLMVYKNYGLLFEKECVNYDSASYYFKKAMTCLDQVEWPLGVLEEVVNAKADLLVELGNTYYNKGDYKAAEDMYINAFDLAKSSSYATGQMLACVGLGLVYSYLAMPTKSLYYIDLFFDLESKTGISITHATMRSPLILNYARLGKFDALESELEGFEEEHKGLLRENSDLYDQLDSLRDYSSVLLSQYETQNARIAILQVQRNHYRLAFFGLLAITLFAIAVWLFRRFLLHNRNRSK